MSTLQLLIDSREKAPLQFPGIDFQITKLAFGDYSARGLRGVFEIERKSPVDLLTTLVLRWGAWLRKCQRWVNAAPRAIVICEGTYDECLNIQGPHKYTLARNGVDLLEMGRRFEQRFGLTMLAGVQVTFVGSRMSASRIIVDLLRAELHQRELSGEPLNPERLRAIAKC